MNVDISVVDVMSLLKKSSEDVVLLDVRTDDEYRAGHLDGAVLQNIHQDDFDERLKQLDREKHYVVYCLSGGRSARAVEVMRQQGFTRVQNMVGGITAWKDEGCGAFVVSSKSIELT